MPSYSRLERTSGAIYAGVPTVDLGLECSRDDCKQINEKEKTSVYHQAKKMNNWLSHLIPAP